MELSKRLAMSAGMVIKGNKVVDVGCDHAYTSIWLVENGVSPSAVASDVRKGPLEHAERNVKAHHLEKKISVRLCDGLKGIKPEEADTILISGMGGPLIAEILKGNKETVKAAEQLVLQPQSEIGEFRHFLHEQGFRIEKEDMVFEDGKFYVSMDVRHAHKPEKYPEEYIYEYGMLCGKNHPVLNAFLDKEEQTCENVRIKLESHMEEGAGKAEEGLARVKEKLELINKAKNAKAE